MSLAVILRRCAITFALARYFQAAAFFDCSGAMLMPPPRRRCRRRDDTPFIFRGAAAF
jgi:hypothetical protein